MIVGNLQPSTVVKSRIRSRNRGVSQGVSVWHQYVSHFCSAHLSAVAGNTSGLPSLSRKPLTARSTCGLLLPGAGGNAGS